MYQSATVSLSEHENTGDTEMTFTLYWLTGDREIVKGRNVADAMTRAGYSNGAVPALDFYANGDDRDYQWDATARKWLKTSA